MGTKNQKTVTYKRRTRRSFGLLFFFFVVYFTTVLTVLSGFAQILREFLFKAFPSILDISISTYVTYYLIGITASAIVFVILVVRTWPRFYGRILTMDKAYIMEIMMSGDLREPAVNREDLKTKLYGKKKIPKKDSVLLDGYIDKNIEPIKRFIVSPDSSTLVINAKWGAGKTTNLLIAINETEDNKRNRYIYESAFKYRVQNGEFVKDLMSTLNDIMAEFGLKIPRQTDGIIKNLDPDIKKTILSLLNNKNEANMLSTGLVSAINKEARRKKINNTVFVIIDDIDRLMGKDIEAILSFLSILRRISFVRIIIPADIEMVQKSLEKIGIIEPALFVDKYLPIGRSVTFQSAYDMAKEIVFRYVAKNNKEIAKEEAMPAIAAIFIGMLSKKMHDLTVTFSNYRFTWLHPSALSKKPDIDYMSESIEQILRIPLIIAENNQSKYHEYGWEIKYNNIKDVQNIVFALFNDKNRKKRFVKNAFLEEDYQYIVESWIYEYMKRRWKIFGFTIRDVLDMSSKLNYDKLPKSQAKQFARVYNQLFPEQQIKCSE